MLVSPDYQTASKYLLVGVCPTVMMSLQLGLILQYVKIGWKLMHKTNVNNTVSPKMPKKR